MFEGINKVVLPRRFKFFFLCYHRFIDVWFVFNFLRHGVVHRLVAAFYLCDDDSDRQNKFDQSKISNYGCQYIEELEL